MKAFAQTYFTMKERDALEFAATRLDYFDSGAKLDCSEIGDGNLNYVFRVREETTGKSLIIKQAGPVARISDEFVVSTDRNRIETEALRLQHKLAPGLVPEVYGYDPVLNCCVMEDLSEYRIMRSALMEYRKFPRFADDIATFLVRTLLLTSDVVLNHKEKKELQKKFVNPDLCEITEDLVYTEPFYDCPRNLVFPPVQSFVREQIWGDNRLQLETAKLKFEFMNHSQSLLHGDLHTGSIFVKEDSTKVIDPEFAFFGPAGYDLGNVVAHLCFAHAHAEATIKDAARKADYTSWLEQTIGDVVDLFSMKFRDAWAVHVKEPVALYNGFAEHYLDSIVQAAAAAAGCELCRRIIGLAQVKDITSITDTDQRVRAEKTCLAAGKTFILERARFRSGSDFAGLIRLVRTGGAGF